MEFGFDSPRIDRRSGQGANAMSGAAELKKTIKVCMFDQYGTVVDMQKGLTEIAAPFLKAKGWTGDANAFVTWWRRTHFENSMIDALLRGPLSGFGNREAQVLSRGPRSARASANAL
jgi:hypothetical protein